jgi:hypothetical protein
MNQFLWGALAALSAVAAIFFWKFWKRTRDQLFATFAAGFAVLAVHWVGLGLLNPSREELHYLYVARFVAFALIAWGVIRKNKSPAVPGR